MIHCQKTSAKFQEHKTDEEKMMALHSDIHGEEHPLSVLKEELPAEEEVAEGEHAEAQPAPVGQPVSAPDDPRDRSVKISPKLHFRIVLRPYKIVHTENSSMINSVLKEIFNRH